MALIQVRDVPDHIYRLLVQQAEQEHRSLAQQTLAVLARALETEMDLRRGVSESSKPFAPQVTVKRKSSATR
jgi:plasmid stability protein